MIRAILALAATLLTSAPGFAHDYALGDLTVEHPMMFATTPVGRTTGGFLSITNTGAVDDALIAVRADFPKIELHTTELSDGVARMIRQDRIAIPAGETVTLQHGGYHIMVMGLRGGLKEGREVPATLVFETAGELDVIFDVEARKGGGMGHSGHGN